MTRYANMIPDQKAGIRNACKPHHMNTAICGCASPVALVENILQTLQSDRTIPVKGFERAKGWLKKMGVSFLITVGVTDNGREKTGLVPIRIVDDNQRLRTFGHVHDCQSWHGKRIWNVCLGYCHDLEAIKRKIVDCLLTVVHHLSRKIQAKIHHTRNRGRRCVKFNSHCLAVH